MMAGPNNPSQAMIISEQDATGVIYVRDTSVIVKAQATDYSGSWDAEWVGELAVGGCVGFFTSNLDVITADEVRGYMTIELIAEATVPA
jgi:hypothetical protein